MNELLLHVLLIWIISALFLILLYDKMVVQQQITRNMYKGKKGYNKKKAKATYIKYIIISGLFSVLVVYFLRLLIH